MRITDVSIKIKLYNGQSVPLYATEGAAGFDLVANEEVVVNPFSTQLIPTGISVGVPPGFELQIRPRSGLSLKTKLRVANSPGTIDSDYRGEIKVVLENTGNVAHVVRKGDRIAQGVLSPVFTAVWQPVEELDVTDRNDGGFGSTGS